MDYVDPKGMGCPKEKIYYIEIGRKLNSAFLSLSSAELASAKLRALIADVVQEDSDLIAPIYELARSGELCELTGVGNSPLKKYLAQQRLADTFSSILVEKVGFVLEGFWGIPPEESEVLGPGDCRVNDSSVPERCNAGDLDRVLTSGLAAKSLLGHFGRLKSSPNKKLGLPLSALMVIIVGVWGGVSFVQKRAGNQSTLNSESTKQSRSTTSSYTYGADANIMQCDERKADRWMRAEKCTALEGLWKGRSMIFASHGDYCRYFRGETHIDRLCKQGAPVSEGYDYSSPDLSCAHVLDPYETPCVMPVGAVGDMKEVAFKSKYYFCSVYGHEICDPTYEPQSPDEIQAEHVGR